MTTRWLDWDRAATGDEMHALCRELYPICRSITGNGVRDTLQIIRRLLPELTIHEVPSGTRCLDWVVPPEWNISDAYIIDPSGSKIIDFKASNLHVVGYSSCVDRKMTLEELQGHLHSKPDQPDAIPYETSYYPDDDNYDDNWGFCLSHRQRQSLPKGSYKVCIKSTIAKGSLTYADLLIRGKSNQEIFFSTYVCHPSLANNELSGPVVSTFLARWIAAHKARRYSYRFVFIPETIGSKVYLSKHYDKLKRNVVAGFNVTCIGDDRCYSYLPSRAGDTLADRVAMHVLQHTDPGFIKYSYLKRGSDERQYCAPGVDLPVATVMRSKYGVYPEYHTSLDNLSFVSPCGLAGGLRALVHCVTALELNRHVRATVLGEPQMGRRRLYTADRMDVLAYADGSDLLTIAEKIERPIWEVARLAQELQDHKLLAEVAQKRSARGAR